MKRADYLEKIVTEDYWARRQWQGLKAESRAFIQHFIEENEALDYHDFAGLVNRMGLSGYKYAEFLGRIHRGQSSRVYAILGRIHKTIPGFYGYQGETRWKHPLDQRVGE